MSSVLHKSATTAPAATSDKPARPASRRWLVLAGLAFVLLAAWPAYRRIGWFQLLDQATRQIQAEDFAAACDTYAKLAARDPANSDVQFRWGVACRRKESYPEADQHFDEAQKLGYSSDAIQHQRNMLRFQLSADPAAEKYLIRLMQEDVSDDQAEQLLEALAIGCLTARRHFDAIGHLTEWLRWRPAALRPHYLRGKAHLDLARLPEAAEDFKVAAAGRPTDTAIRLQYADVLFAGYKYEEAYREYAAVEGLQPERANAVLGRGRCANELGNAEEARECLERVLKLDAMPPQRAVALTELARIQFDNKQPEAAARLLEEALELREDDVTAHTLMASALARLQRTDEAVIHRNRAQELTAYYTELDDLKRSVEKTPQDPKLLWRVGKQLLLCNRPLEALDWLNAAIQKAPEAYSAHESLAECWEKLDQPALAKKHRQQAAMLRSASAGANP